jgi:hypothetical protein
MALGAVLVAPALAQQAKTEVRATGNATAQAAQATPRPTLPTQAAQPAQQAVQGVTQQRPTEDTTPPADATDFKEARDPTQAPTAQDTDTDDDAMEDGMQAQGGVNAAAHSTAAQRDVWTRLDADADGQISAVEADADAAFGLDFDDMDTDDDGFVSDMEYRAFARTDAQGDMGGQSQGAANAAAHSMVVTRDLWTRLDADADGRISADEADADTAFDGGFAGYDTNADGFVTQEEYRAAAQAEASQGAENAAPPSAVVQRDTWTRLDADADGRISADEADADAGFDSDFAAMDSNGDGFVTDAEFRAHAKADMQP